MDNLNKIEFPLYCIGDSHAGFFAGIDKIQRVWPSKSKNFLPFFKVFLIGPILAYNLVKEGTKNRGREKLFGILRNKIPKGSTIMLSFGEIDCRAHLIKQSKLHKQSIESVVSKCVNRYFTTIKEIKKMGYKVLVWNAIPSTLLNKIDNNTYPVFGSCKERNMVTHLFNENLQKKCKKERVLFISVYKYFMNKQGLTNMSYYMDEIHLSQKAMPVVLRIIGNELKLNFRLTPGQFLKYKIINLYWDLFTILRVFWRKI